MKNFSDASESVLIKYRYIFLTIGSGLLYVAFLGLRDVWYPGEPDMGEVALAMFNSGDWISPRLMGDIWITYPPMMYWGANVFSHLFGDMSAFTLRLPNAFSATGIVLITCWFGTKWFSARTGFWAGFAILISLSFVWQANSYRPDVLFALGISAGLFFYAEGVEAERQQWLKIFGFACLGFAMLSKGILGLLLPGLVLVLWHGARREWKPIVLLAPLSLASITIFMLWVNGVAQAMGWENVLNEFYSQNLGRFASGSLGHERPFWYYFRSFWLDLWPWSILFPAALIWTIRTGLWRDSKVQLVLWWFASFLVFLTFAETKRQLYLLPAYPAIVLILGRWLATVGLPEEQRPIGLTAPGKTYVRIATYFIAIVFGVLGIGSLLYPALYKLIIVDRNLGELELAVATGLQVPLVVLGVVMIIGVISILRAIIRRDIRKSLICTGISQVAVLAVFLAFVLPALQPTKSFGPQSRWIKQQIGPEVSHIGMVFPVKGLQKRGGFAYEMGGTMVELIGDRNGVDAFLAKYPESIVLVNEDSLDTIFAGDEDGRKSRILRTLLVNDTSYSVVRAPARD